jgi:hypothetical protein
MATGSELLNGLRMLDLSDEKGARRRKILRTCAPN